MHLTAHAVRTAIAQRPVLYRFEGCFFLIEQLRISSVRLDRCLLAETIAEYSMRHRIQTGHYVELFEV